MNGDGGNHDLCELKTQIAILTERVLNRDKALKVAELGSHYLMSSLLAVVALLVSFYAVYKAR